MIVNYTGLEPEFQAVPRRFNCDCGIERFFTKVHLEMLILCRLPVFKPTGISNTVVLNRVALHMEGSIDFKGGARPYALCNMERLINKLINKYICLCNLFIVKAA